MANDESKSSGWPLRSMAMGGPVVFIVALLALVRAFFNPSSEPAKSQSGTPSSPAPASTASSADSQEGAITPLLDFLRLSHGPADPGSACIDHLLSAEDHVEVLIATVPDPKRSRVASQFDMAIEAIRRALEKEGYELDRYRLPWAEPEGSPAKAEAGPAGAAAGRSADAADRKPAARNPITSRQPGSILFRKSQELTEGKESDESKSSGLDLLLLLLVAESPTTGIDKDQFWNALDLSSQLASHRKDRGQAWRVLGPSFSGSANEMARTLARWHESRKAKRGGCIPTAFWVCSGSATNLDKCMFEELAGPANALLAATVIPDERILEEVIRWFRERDSSLSEPGDEASIALLVEAGTGYSEWATTRARTSPTAKAPTRKLIIPFPLHVSVEILLASKNTCTMAPVVKTCTTVPVADSTSELASRTSTPVIRLISCRNGSAEVVNNCR